MKEKSRKVNQGRVILEEKARKVTSWEGKE